MSRAMLKELTQALSHPEITSGFANSTIGSNILLEKKHPGLMLEQHNPISFKIPLTDVSKAFQRIKVRPKSHSKTCLSIEK